MTDISRFLLHTFIGRVLLIGLFLFVSLLVATMAGWLPAAF